MPSCSSIDLLVTPYIDGELPDAARATLEQHLQACPPCYSRVSAERAVRELLHTRQSSFQGECAPPVLRAKCAGCCGIGAGFSGIGGLGRRAFWSGAAPLAAAAVLVLIVGGVWLHQATARSPRVMAAELTADHLKCFTMNAVLGTHQTSESVERAMASGFNWDMRLPAAAEGEGLELVGSRPCLYGEGRVAHIMYRHHGEPVSLFMLPKTVQTAKMVEVLGHECAIWSDDDRTFVLVARESRSDVARLAAFAQSAFH
jgi:anti-sigma factor RsiW